MTVDDTRPPPRGSLARPVLLALVGAAAFLAIWVLTYAFGQGGPTQLDSAWAQTVRGWSSPAATAVALTLDRLGGPIVAGLVVPAVAAVVVFRRCGLPAALYLVAASATSAVLVKVVKLVTARARPQDIMVHTDFGSFPSGHCANAALIAAVLTLLLPRHRWIPFAGAVYVVLMMFSRTYLAAHWLSDTVAGALLGFTVATTMWAIFARRVGTPSRMATRAAPCTGYCQAPSVTVADMTHNTTLQSRTGVRQMLNKVPEITIWFWVIKILCTTVGESFADWINMKLGVGLVNTAVIFTVVLVVVLAVQLRLNRYVPLAYWLTVVVVSITGTLYTDILTDSRGVPLAVSTTAFSALLAVVFAVWYTRERTLSIHSIVTSGREAFYWLAVLVTFALGTAAGDWTLELTGWGPGASVLLPASLIAVVVIGWRFGGNPVLAFWLAYILTRPLGANIGDWFATPSSEQGLGLGTALTSVIFLVAIGATVLYLSLSRVDVIAEGQESEAVSHNAGPRRERTVLAGYLVAALAATALLHHTSQLPHATVASEEGPSTASTVHLTPAEATAHLPAADVAQLSGIAQDTLTTIQAGNQRGATARVKDLETLWDKDQPRLESMDATAWTFIDGQIDDVLTAMRASSPDTASEKQALTTLITTLGGGA